MLAPEPLARASRPPNIVYFVTDDQDQMLGGSFPTTSPGGATPLPKVKKLMADGGVMFENMFIHVPICGPSRATTLTGRYFHNIKTTHAQIDAMHCDLDGKVHNHSFAVRLQQRGYALALFGKYLNAMPGAETSKAQDLTWEQQRLDSVKELASTYVPAGWSAWFANTGGDYIGPSFATHGLMDAAGIADGSILFDSAPGNYSTSVIGNVSMAWIRHTVATEPERPFFAYIAPKAVSAHRLQPRRRSEPRLGARPHPCGAPPSAPLPPLGARAF